MEADCPPEEEEEEVEDWAERFFCLSRDARRKVLVTTLRTVMLAVADWNLCLGSCPDGKKE